MGKQTEELTTSLHPSRLLRVKTSYQQYLHLRQNIKGQVHTCPGSMKQAVGKQHHDSASAIHTECGGLRSASRCSLSSPHLAWNKVLKLLRKMLPWKKASVLAFASAGVTWTLNCSHLCLLSNYSPGFEESH